MTRDNDHNCECSVCAERYGSSPPMQDTLCWDDEDWDWWLKLPPAQRGAVVKHYREAIAIVRDEPQEAPKLSDFAELKLLIDEYDPENSDWNFRRGVLLDILVRVWPKSSPLSRPKQS